MINLYPEIKNLQESSKVHLRNFSNTVEQEQQQQKSLRKTT